MMNEFHGSPKQDCILLAYYFGQHNVLNCLALHQITLDLINTFDTPPFNKTTKYSGHVDGCCICHEKESIFKELVKEYHNFSQSSKKSKDKIDIDDAWNDLVLLWNEFGLVTEGDSTPLIGIEKKRFKFRCAELLKKHGIIFDESRQKQLPQNWNGLLQLIKAALEKCVRSLSRINGGNLHVTPLLSQCPHFSKLKLRNVYLTMVINKGARAQAKFLQECRKVGIQIRAAKDPIAVVAKYMMCAKCLHKQKRHQIITIPDILKHSIDHFDSTMVFSKVPQAAEKLCTGHNRLQSVAVVKSATMMCTRKKINGALEIVDVNTEMHGQIKPKHVFHVVHSPPVSIQFDSKAFTERKSKRRLSLPAKVDNRLDNLDNSDDIRKESFKVVIVSSNGPESMTISAATTATVASLSASKSAAGSTQNVNVSALRSQRHIGFRSVRLIKAAQNSSTLFASTAQKLPLLLNSNSSCIMAPSRTRSISMDQKYSSPILFRTIKPVSVIGMKNRTLVQTSKPNNLPERPFVVKIIDSKLKNSATCNSLKANEPVIRTHPLSNGGIKLLKAVSVKSQNGGSQMPKSSGYIVMKSLKITDQKRSRNIAQDSKGISPLLPINIHPSIELNTTTGISTPLQSNCYRALHASPVDVSDDTSCDFKKLSSHCWKPVAKTPNKKKTKHPLPSKPISTIVAEYVFSLMPSPDKDLWKKLQTQAKRRSEKTVSMIPVPYEANYLCIHDTLEKAGWKAYRYWKCRFSKISEKVAGLDNNSDTQAGHSQSDIIKWIPKELTKEMRYVFAASFERDAAYFSPSSNFLSSAPQEAIKTCRKNLLLTAQDKMPEKCNLTGVRPELEPKDACQYDFSVIRNVSASKELKRKFIEKMNAPKNSKGSPTTLKSKYRRGENGHWVAMNNNNKSSKQSIQDSCAGLRLNFQVGSESNQMLISTPHIEDAVGTTTSRGLRRCPRATMIRRKVLVERATRYEANTKAKKRKSQFRLLENFVLSSSCESSWIGSGFNVISAHETNFKEYDELYEYVATERRKRIGVKHAICCYEEHVENGDFRDSRYYENMLAGLMDRSSNSISMNRFLATKKRKMSVADNSNLTSNSRSTPNIFMNMSPLSQHTRQVIGKITSESMWENTKPSPAMSGSASESNILSAADVKFVLRALNINFINSPGKRFITERKRPQRRKRHSRKKGLCINAPIRHIFTDKTDLNDRHSFQDSYKCLVSDNNFLEILPWLKPKTEIFPEDHCFRDEFLSASALCSRVVYQSSKELHTFKVCDKSQEVNNFVNAPCFQSIFGDLKKASLMSRYGKYFPVNRNKDCAELYAFQTKLKKYITKNVQLSYILGPYNQPEKTWCGLKKFKWQDTSDKMRTGIFPENGTSTGDLPKVQKSKDELSPEVGRNSSVNRRKRLGIQCIPLNIASEMEILQRPCKCDINSESDSLVTYILGKRLDVQQIKRSIWDGTSARPIKLRDAEITIDAHHGSTLRERVDLQSDGNFKVPSNDVFIGSSIPENGFCCSCKMILIKHKNSLNVKLHGRPRGISQSKKMRMCSNCIQNVNNSSSDHISATNETEEVSAPRSAYVSDQLPHCLLKNSSVGRLSRKRRLTRNSQTKCRMQALREVVYAEIQDKKKKNSSVGDAERHFSKSLLISDQRKLNRFSSDGSFISRLLESDDVVI